jgi:ABC-type antimicrobial peptide transport system permease subunit
MSANIYDQTKEIGILRALGYMRLHLVLLYVYEAFILVMASSFLGVIVGTIVAYTMMLQFSAFVGTPPVMYYPWV